MVALSSRGGPTIAHNLLIRESAQHPAGSVANVSKSPPPVRSIHQGPVWITLRRALAAAICSVFAIRSSRRGALGARLQMPIVINPHACRVSLFIALRRLCTTDSAREMG